MTATSALIRGALQKVHTAHTLTRDAQGEGGRDSINFLPRIERMLMDAEILLKQAQSQLYQLKLDLITQGETFGRNI